MAGKGKVEVFVSEMAKVPARDLDVACKLVRGILGSPGDRHVSGGKLLVGCHG